MTSAARATTRRLALVAAAGSVVALVPGVALGAGAGPTGDERVIPKIEGLDGPRGIDVGPGRRLVYTQADGTITETILRGDEAGTAELGAVPPGFIAPAVSLRSPSSAWVLTQEGDPADGASTVYLWRRGGAEMEAVADIAAYQATDPDPFNEEGDDVQSNPYNVVALPDGSALVADAGNNDLLRVTLDGDVETIARIKPRAVLVPEELEDQPEMPPPGTPIVAEGVITSVTVGADGAYYIGELRGFPATPGTSQVWRVEPDAVDAVCDPEKPNQGDCRRYADGFTSIVDLAAGPDGEIFVLELVKQSWLQWELGIADPVGGLYRIPAGGGDAVEIARDRLVLPGGVDVSNKHKIFVTGPTFDEGAIVRVR